MTIRIGIVGGGFISQVAHIPHYVSNQDCQLAAIAELRPRLGESLCRRWNVPALYPSHRELLADPNIDAVVVVVRRHHTASIALEVIRSGKALLTEKPMAQTFEQAKLLCDESETRSIFYTVGFMRRYDPAVVWVKDKLTELRSSGDLGRLLTVRLTLSAGGDYCNIGGEIKSSEPKPLDLLMPIAPSFLPQGLHHQFEHFVNVCGHDINLLHYLFEDCVLVPRHFEYRKNRGSIVVIDFGEFSGTFEWSDTLQPKSWDEYVEIIFERGHIKLELAPAFLRNQPSKASLYIDSGTTDGYFMAPRPDWLWAFEEEDREFVRCLTAGKPTRSMGVDCLKDMALIENIWMLLKN
jgi:predicted dehydrogenase